ncbi:MAG: carboxypeptidase regulatory-like domain-containing protein [Acidobacteriota bacterium]|nr:MAG: carboxypeptidase regulatory-like domain-containing protein [Acidobacteriota bacterium]
MPTTPRPSRILSVFPALFAMLTALLLLVPGTPTIAQQAASQLRGVLLEQEGLPAVSYQIGLKSETGDLFLSPPTKADGSFTIANIPAGSYKLVAFDPTGAEFPVLGPELVLEPGQTQRLELRLSGPGQTPGRVIEPVAAEADGNWFSRLWNRGVGGKVAIFAMVVGGAWGTYELIDDDEATKSPSEP